MANCIQIPVFQQYNMDTIDRALVPNIFSIGPVVFAKKNFKFPLNIGASGPAPAATLAAIFFDGSIQFENLGR